MEMNANEKCYLSAEPCNARPGHHHHHHQLRTKITQRKNIESASPNPKRGLHNRCPPQCSSPKSSVATVVSDAGMDADAGLKAQCVKARCWRRGKRERVGSTGAANDDEKEKRPSSDHLQKTPSVEDHPQIKPRNCRRIVVLGAPRVGKTNLVRRFLGDGFEERYAPTAEDFRRKMYRVRGTPYLVDVLDAPRERDFPAKRRLSILTGDIFLLAFSLDDRDSLEEVRALRHEILSSKATLLKLKDPPRVPMVICGNKADLAAGTRAVSRSEIGEVLGEEGEDATAAAAAYFETSAKSGSGLEDAFRALVTLGGLPCEVVPSQHRTVSLHAYRSLLVSHRRPARRPSGGSGGEEVAAAAAAAAADAPCATLCASARRPSFNSDLRLVLGSSSSSSKNKPKKCQIQ
ncbi:unnamed protein product [Merluccius merluccius]